MNKTYDYIMLINMEDLPETYSLYECDYKFDSVEYMIEVYESGVCIHRKMYSEMNIWTFDFVSKDINDVLRKAYVLYAMCTGKGLIIRNIKVFCDKNEIRTINNACDDDFPFVYSMLGKRGLIRDWDVSGPTGIFNNGSIMDYLSKSKRSDDQNDKRIIALFAFILGRSREYESDRFINYWTAINSIYSYLNTEHNVRIDKLIKALPADKMESFDITEHELKLLLMPIGSKEDYAQLNLFTKLVQKRKGIKPKKRGSNIEKALEQFNNEYNNAYRNFATKYTDIEGSMRLSYERLYELVISEIEPGKFQSDNINEKKSYAFLEEWSGKTGTSLFILLSISEPYYMRNFYIHGSEAPLMISDPYHLHLISCLNYFMDRLLCEYIPILFYEINLKSVIDDLHKIIYDQSISAVQKDPNDPKNSETAKKARKLAATVKDSGWLAGNGL